LPIGDVLNIYHV